jgi:protein phosphatase
MTDPTITPPGAAAASADTVTLQRRPACLRVRSFGVTDRGKVRSTNQDQFLVAALRKALEVRYTSLPSAPVRFSDDQCHLFVVADGVGGNTGGEEASALAIASVEAFMLATCKWFEQVQSKEQELILTDFQTALSEANNRVLAEAEARPELRGMGTTLTLAYCHNDMLFVAHVGDSRCYLFRQGGLYRLTRDHTLVEEMVRRGHLSAEEAAAHQWRHVITNVVGGDSPGVTVEVNKMRLEVGDAVLVCSDGLTNMVSEKEIASVLQAEASAERACGQLLMRANEEGGKDNITVVVARFDSPA